MTSVDKNIIQLHGVGKTLMQKLSRIGIHMCRDVLWRFPFRFDDFSKFVSIAQLQPHEMCTIKGKIQLIANRRSYRKRMMLTEALVSDESGSIKVIWFNQPFLTQNLVAGESVYLSGKTSDSFLDLHLVNPSYEKESQEQPLLHTARLVPVYSLKDACTQKQFRSLVQQCMLQCLDMIEDELPSMVREQENLFNVRDALFAIHFPKSSDEWKRARYRFTFEELLCLHMRSRVRRKRLLERSAYPIPISLTGIRSYINSLPYALTRSQKKAAWDILKSLERSHPMNRLLEGDVGSGKTVVSSIAMFSVMEAGFQCAYMAPTELLAEQQAGVFAHLFRATSYRIGLLTSSVWRVWMNGKECEHIHRLTKKVKAQIQKELEDGSIRCIVGTHALIEKNKKYHALACVIIDEQHRFGVTQRMMLRKKQEGEYIPHFLSMTATPIPRTLALTVYGDLDLSVIEGLPKGRKKVITKVVPTSFREWTYEFIRKHIARGEAVFVVCPCIDESDRLGVKSVTQEYHHLSKNIFPHARLAMIHGRMKTEEKERVMKQFSQHEIDMVVATSLIEVGIDIPHATIMVIEGAERFGLAQLHQFRGRVGRGARQSYCFLFPSDESEAAMKRLRIFERCRDSRELAQQDLVMRGYGELEGVEQSGTVIGNGGLLSDFALIEKTGKWADWLIETQGTPSFQSEPWFEETADERLE